MTPHTESNHQTIRLTVRSDELEVLRSALVASGFPAHDTGDRILTDDGIDAEAVLAVSVPNYPVGPNSQRVAGLLKL